MQYISPLHFIEPSAAGAIERKDILLARKKMLAELELNEGRGVEINGKEVSKNDIIRFFDEFQQSSQLSYHIVVYRDKVLLRFLEQGILGGKDRFAQDPLYTDEAFIDWISPYYADSFIAYSTDCFRLLNVEKWGTLMNNPLLMNTYYREIAWEGLEKKIRADIHRLEFIGQKKLGRNDLVELGRLCDTRRLNMLSQPPIERLSIVRDEMAFALMQVCITLFNIGKHEWAFINMGNAHMLAISAGLKEQIHNTHTEMKAFAKKGKLTQWKRVFRSIGRMGLIYGGIFSFLFFIGLIVDKENKNTHKDDTAPVQQQQPSPTPILPKDSIRLHKTQDPFKQQKKEFPK